MTPARALLLAALSTGVAGCAGCGGPPDGPGDPPSLAGCRLFPADNPWNQVVTGLPRRSDEAAILANMSPGTGLHPDWGDWSNDHYGIPWSSGTGAAPVALSWTTSWGDSESDELPCPGG